MVKISRKFQVSPEVLSASIDDNMAKIVQEQIVGSCSETNGYIIEASNIISRNAVVSEATGLVDIAVDFEAECVKPEIGSNYSGRVCLVFDMGVLIDIAGVLKVLIPITDQTCIVDGTPRNAVYNPLLNTLTVSTPKPLKIEKDMIIRVEVSGVQYNAETNSFNCFGNLKE
jgi:DNA-directed RNA polymerase subunit E'/Rpb7